MGRSLTLGTFSRRALVTREARTRQRGSVPLPPMPVDPNVCRWCDSTRVTLSTGDVICTRGCAPNDSTPYTFDCDICGQEFQTGSSSRTCWKCARREHSASIADQGPKPVGYEADMRGKGADRAAMRIKEREQ